MTLAIFKYDFANCPSIYITKKKQAWLTLSESPGFWSHYSKRIFCRDDLCKNLWVWVDNIFGVCVQSHLITKKNSVLIIK